MSKDKIEVSMNVYDIPIVIEALEKAEDEIKKLNNILQQADNKNLELIEIINEIYDVIEDKNITEIEARLKIQEILDKDN